MKIKKIKQKIISYKKYKSKNAFTLIELLVVIALISIVGIGVSSIDFNAISDKEKNTGFNDKIRTSIETIKNNAIIGKGIGIDLIVPDFWKISLTSTGASTNGSIDFYYGTGIDINSTTWHDYDRFNIKWERHQKITKLNCLKTDRTDSDLINKIDIQIRGKNLTLSGCTNDDTHKIIEITTSYKNFSKTIDLNTVSGVITY